MPALASVTDGELITNVGAVLSTIKVEEGPVPEAVFPEASDAVPEAIEMETVPSPVQLVSVIVRVEAPAPLTAFEQVAVPVVLSEISPEASVTADAPV